MVMRKAIGGLIALGVTTGLYLGIEGAIDSQRSHYSRLLQDSNSPITATVLEEVYNSNLSPVPAFSGMVSHSNETVKLDSSYSLKVRTDKGRVLGVSVIDNNDTRGLGGNPDKEALDRLVDEGTRIQFPRGNLVKRDYTIYETSEITNETYFHPDTQIGNKRADRITVLD